MKKCFIAFDEVASLENLAQAWQEFIKGKRNKKDVQVFALNLADEFVDLHDCLMDGSYEHGPYAHFRINDPKPRDIHKAAVRDRLLHHAIHRKLYPYFVEHFVRDSFSCQTGKGLHRAINRFRDMGRKVSKNSSHGCWVLKCDIRKFFASVDHAVLIGILRKSIKDEKLVNLLKCVIMSFEAVPGKGIPLGNLTSQLFSNVYMNVFDQFVKRRLEARYYVRYADDFVFLSDRRDVLEQTLPKLVDFLHERLKLTMHPDKISIKTFASGIDFLGWIHFPRHRVPRAKTKKRALKRNRLELRVEILHSYLGIFFHGNAHEVQKQLKNDYWLFADLQDVDEI